MLCVEYELEDEKIKGTRVYFEMPVLLQQLGPHWGVASEIGSESVYAQAVGGDRQAAPWGVAASPAEVGSKGQPRKRMGGGGRLTADVRPSTAQTASGVG